MGLREKTALKTIQLLRKLAIDLYREIDSSQNVDIVGVMADKAGGILTSGFVKFYVPPGPHQYIRLRNMVRDAVMLKFGPVAPEKPHKIILLLLPSFVWHTRKNMREFLGDWPGTTYLGEYPYCTYTIMR